MIKSIKIDFSLILILPKVYIASLQWYDLLSYEVCNKRAEESEHVTESSGILCEICKKIISARLVGLA